MRIVLPKKSKEQPKSNMAIHKVKIKKGVTELNIDSNEKKSELTSDNKEKAKILNKYFSSVFTREPDDELLTFQPNKIKWNCYI